MCMSKNKIQILEKALEKINFAQWKAQSELSRMSYDWEDLHRNWYYANRDEHYTRCFQDMEKLNLKKAQILETLERELFFIEVATNQEVRALEYSAPRLRGAAIDTSVEKTRLVHISLESHDEGEEFVSTQAVKVGNQGRKARHHCPMCKRNECGNRWESFSKGRWDRLKEQRSNNKGRGEDMHRRHPAESHYGATNPKPLFE